MKRSGRIEAQVERMGQKWPIPKRDQPWRQNGFMANYLDEECGRMIDYKNFLTIRRK